MALTIRDSVKQLLSNVTANMMAIATHLDNPTDLLVIGDNHKHHLRFIETRGYE